MTEAAGSILDAINTRDEHALSKAIRQLVNLTMFGRYWSSSRGILIQRDNDRHWDIQPVARWDDAVEAERRAGAPWIGEWPTVYRR